MQVLWLAMAFLSAGVLATKEQGNKRPFWNIAHMINDIKHFDAVLKDGANAMEADVTYDSSGKPTSLYHGSPCDAHRWCSDYSEIPPYIKEVRERTTPDNSKYNHNFALMEFDHKLGGVKNGNFKKAGKLFAEHMLDLYSGSSKVKVLMSLPKISQKEFVSGFREEILASKKPELIKNFGYEFSWESKKDPTIERDAFKSVGVTDPYIWLSNGITNFSPAEINFDTLLKYRDEKDRFATKVYGWTADKYGTLRKWVAKGLDGIITNKPNRLTYVLKGFWKSHRLATQDDNPFEWVKPQSFYQDYGCSYHPGRLYNYCWKTCPGSTGWCWTNTYCGKNENLCYKENSCHSKEQEKNC